jgi:hypothetical protein
LARSLRDQLRQRTTSTVDAESIRETGQEDAEGGDDANHVGTPNQQLRLP